jgi:DnaK suppressor protein
MQEEKMQEEKMQEIRKELLDQRERLLVEVRQKRSEAARVQDEGVADPGDASVTEDLRDLLYRLGDSKREQILSIDSALERMERGGYGLCAECGEEINLRRLELQPDTLWCVDCKGLMEKRQAIIEGPDKGKI